jgi:transmembrane 9 superfamily protein 2/4
MLPLSLLVAVSGYYLPGMAPNNYLDNDQISVLVNALTSQKNMPFDYYNPKFHFCQPEAGPIAQSESVGSILMGDRLFNSPFNVC